MSRISFRPSLALILSSFIFVGAYNQTSDSQYCLNNIDAGQFTAVGNKYYHFSETKATWFRSFLECRTLGGHLASFDTDEELVVLSNFMKSKFTHLRKWWISAADLNIDGEFHWYSTGRGFNYTSLSFRRPSSWKKVEQCGHLHYTNDRYQVNDSKCKDEEYFVCDLDGGEFKNHRN